MGITNLSFLKNKHVRGIKPAHAHRGLCSAIYDTLCQIPYSKPYITTLAVP